MAELTKENKEKLKNLERDIKVAFKENHLDAVQDLADEIKVIDPENHLTMRLLEKMEKAKADTKKKENAAKIKEYQTMLGKMLKDGNLDNVHKLADELKEFDPKSAGEWIKKAEDAEIKVKQKQNADKIKVLEKDLKVAFKENRFEEVKTIADKIKEFDPQNKAVIKAMTSMDKAKADAKRKENADQINVLQDQIKTAFKEVRFDDLGQTANKLFEIDPDNKFAKKYLAKSVKAKGKVEKVKEVKAVKAEDVPVEKAKEEIKTPVVPELPKEEAVTPMPAKPTVTPAVPPVPKPVVPAVTQPAQKPTIAPVAPVVKAPVVAEPKEAVKAPVPPVVPIAPVTPKPEPTKAEAVIPTSVPAPEKAPAVPEKAEVTSEEKGNVFTRMFGKKEETPKEADNSIIETILEKTTAKKAEEKVVKMKKPEEKEEGLALAKFGKMFLQFATVFILVTAAFFYVQTVDKNNTVLGFVGIEDNYAGKIHKAGLTIEEKVEEERVLNRDISRFKKGYDNKYEVIIDGIIGKRMDWSDMITKVDEVANAVYERNEISQYITFNSYSFNADTGHVNVSGSLSDPLGKNLTKLVELEEAFKNYPRDPDNPDDTREPYFYDFKEFTALSKSFNRQTGKYTSNFSLSFSLKKPTK